MWWGPIAALVFLVWHTQFQLNWWRPWALFKWKVWGEGQKREWDCRELTCGCGSWLVRSIWGSHARAARERRLDSSFAGYCFASENSRFGVSCKKTKGQSASQSIVAKGFWCNKWAHTQSLGRTWRQVTSTKTYRRTPSLKKNNQKTFQHNYSVPHCHPLPSPVAVSCFSILLHQALLFALQLSFSQSLTSPSSS